VLFLPSLPPERRLAACHIKLARMMHLSPESRGSLAMVAAMALFVVNDALVKLATASLPVSQLLAVRGVFASLITFGIVIALGQGRALSAMRSPRVALRATLEGLVAFTFITALAKLPLANITAILQAASLIIVALAAIMGIDRIGWRRGLALVVGFIGVLLVVKPSAEGFNAFSVLALISAVLVAVRDLVTRNIAEAVPSGVVAFATTLAVMIAGLVIGAGESLMGIQPWAPLTSHNMLFLIAAAVAVALGNTCIIIAYRDGDVALVSGLRYSVLVFALIMGFVIFAEWPDVFALAGAGLIVGSGLYALHRQRVRRLASLGQHTSPANTSVRDAG
jgi:drug/metabolite transporter (DMT)-like permease